VSGAVRAPVVGTTPPARSKPNGSGQRSTAPVELPPLPVGESAFDLLERELPEPKKWCDPWAVEGVNLIASRPKLGKTTMLRQKAAALASGEEFLGAQCLQTHSVILSLEEGARLMRNKFKRARFSEASLAAIRLFYQWPRGADGVALLDRYLKEHPEVGHVGIDSLSKFRDVPDSRTPAFIADYEAMSRLHEMAKRLPGRSIDVIHHTRKARGDDPIDDISGTYGLTAACDSYLVLRHHEDGALMYAGGRLWDLEVSEYRLRRVEQRWEMIGENKNLTGGQELTLEHVRRSGGLKPSELAKQLGISKQSAWERLKALVEKGVAYQRGGVFHEKP
jgi:hypothetical protein